LTWCWLRSNTDELAQINPRAVNSWELVVMATLEDAFRAEDRKPDGSWSSVLASPGELLRRVLSFVSPFYGYGLEGSPNMPKVNLEAGYVVDQLRQCRHEVDRSEVQRNALVVDEPVGNRIRILLGHLPDVIEREGWTSELTEAVNEICKILASASEHKSGAPLNLMFHSIMSDLRNLESVPAPIAASLLKILSRWSDLESVVLHDPTKALTTGYFSSTLEIGREMSHKLRDETRRLAAVQESSSVFPEATRVALKRSQDILQNNRVVSALLAHQPQEATA